MAIEQFEQLAVWQKSHEMVLLIYRTTSTFPDNEKYGLVSQMRRAAVSVPANIAEGFKRRGQRDKVHFYNISQGSLEEVRYYLRLARDLEYSRRHEWESEHGKGSAYRGAAQRAGLPYLLPTTYSSQR